jgi:histidinol-phosphate/aromatic aminotransferase/cobyric acid decarboxylase-like protein
MSTSVVATGMPAPRARRRMDARTNLSSNELDHPAIPGLLRTLVSGFDPTTLRCYPEQQLAVVAAAGMLGLASAEELVLGAGSDSLLRLIQHELCEELGGSVNPSVAQLRGLVR